MAKHISGLTTNVLFTKVIHHTKPNGQTMKILTILLTLAICSCQPLDGYQNYYIWEQIGG